MSKTFEGFINIENRGLLLVQGSDAKKFLQGQVTCDIDPLFNAEPSLSTLGAHCTPKGRMLFSFRAFLLDDETIALSMVKSLIADAKKALEKYSVFSKVDITDASDEYRILGFCANNDSTAEGLSELPTAPNHTLVNQQGTIIALDEHHFEYILDKASGDQLLLAYPAEVPSIDWEQVKIAAGIAEVTPETVDMFIPQMLNYQAIGTGVSFTKGCYTGQEVVARMQYLGKLKRRLFAFSINQAGVTTLGAPLYTKGSTQSIGNIVATYQGDNGKTELLAVATEAAVENNSVYLDSDGQQKLQQQPLPYAIPKE